MKTKVNIVGADNGAGLSRDFDVLIDVLSGGPFTVFVNGIRTTRRRSFYARGKRFLLQRLRGELPLLRTSSSARPQSRSPFDVNLFLEHLTADWYPYARRNYLIPNPEWFREGCHEHLPQVDLVLCKTRHAQERFDELGCETRWIGFTSLDRRDETVPRDFGIFLHVAGRSVQKGTEALVDVWRMHPEWPVLTIVQRPLDPESTASGEPLEIHNVQHVVGYMEDDTLRTCQNSHGVHLCPSESEGFGHYIAEAMSCGAVVVTTNAPPMNELVGSDRGVLVDYDRTSVQRLATNYHVDAEDLEHKIEQILAMDAPSKAGLGAKARSWYEHNDRLFRHRLVEVLSRSG